MSARPLLPLPPGARVVGVYVNGVQQAPGRDYVVDEHAIVLRRPLTPFRPVGAVGNVLTALCATVLPSGDEVDVVVDTPTGRRVLDLSPSVEGDFGP